MRLDSLTKEQSNECAQWESEMLDAAQSLVDEGYRDATEVIKMITDALRG